MLYCHTTGPLLYSLSFCNTTKVRPTVCLSVYRIEAKTGEGIKMKKVPMDVGLDGDVMYMSQFPITFTNHRQLQQLRTYHSVQPNNLTTRFSLVWYVGCTAE